MFLHCHTSVASIWETQTKTSTETEQQVEYYIDIYRFFKYVLKIFQRGLLSSLLSNDTASDFFHF